MPKATRKQGTWEETPARLAARNRNHKIRMLRGMYSMAKGYMSSDHAKAVCAFVDQELAYLGAEPESVRVAKARVRHETEAQLDMVDHHQRG